MEGMDASPNMCSVHSFTYKRQVRHSHKPTRRCCALGTHQGRAFWGVQHVGATHAGHVPGTRHRRAWWTVQTLACCLGA